MFHAKGGKDEQRKGDGEAYQKHKARAAERQRKNSSASREISTDFPKVKNRRRRKKALADPEYFCKVYFSKIFNLPFSDDQKRILKKIHMTVKSGGQFALAMPRGSGKTVFCIVLCIFAALTGLHEFLMLIGATSDDAAESLEAIVSELEHNDLLAEDFPEVCYPIRRLEGIRQRRLLYKGQPVLMEITDKRVVLPNLPKNPASSVCIAVRGITGRIRGAKFARPDGRIVRPTLALGDDLQTDESARSDKQCSDREKSLKGAVLGLAGPGKKVALLIPCTVIEPGDFADRILDRKLNPQFHGERTQFVYKWPESEEAVKLWAEYAEIRKQCQRDDRPTDEATEFYRKNRAAMDAGAVVAWEHRYADDEISALQHAYNFRIDRGDAAMFAEMQNQPIKLEDESNKLPSFDDIIARVDGRKRGIVPLYASHLTAMIDVHDELLYWMVCGFGDGFRGGVVDYGTFPEQRLEYFTLKAAQKTLSQTYKGGPESKFTNSVTDLFNFLLLRDWIREDGMAVRIKRLLIDANYEDSTNHIYTAARRHPQYAIILPSHGRGVGAGSQRISEWKRTPGERFGEEWKVGPGSKRRMHVTFDTNHWKSFLFQRLAITKNDAGSLMLFGDRPASHRMLGEHWTAELRDRMRSEKTGRTVDEFKLKPNRPDNHLLDCMVGCLVGASIEGCRVGIPGTEAPRRRKKLKVSF